MIRICAWCQADLGETPDGPPDLISHGICDTCQQKEIAKLKKTRKLPLPIILPTPTKPDIAI